MDKGKRQRKKENAGKRKEESGSGQDHGTLLLLAVHSAVISAGMDAAIVSL